MSAIGDREELFSETAEIKRERPMLVKTYFYYEIAVEKQPEYLKFVAEELKPFFEAHGARSYDIYQNAKPENSTSFIAEMLFDDMPTMQKTLALHGSDPKYDAMVHRFFSFVSEPGVKPAGRYVQKI